MKAWLTRYLTKTNLLTLFVSTSIFCFLLVLVIQLVGNHLWGTTQFARLVEEASPWLLPFRVVFYAIAARYWWLYCRVSMKRSRSPDDERRKRNRISVAIALYIAVVEYACWTSNAVIEEL